MCKLFSSIWPIDRTLSGATTTGQSGPGSNGNERVLNISQSSSITEARVDLWAMAIEGCSAFPKAPVSLELYYQIV